MTTIAIKDGIVSADTRMIGSYIEPSHVVKIRKIRSVLPQFIDQEVIVGGSGMLSDVLEFVDWVQHSGVKEDYKWSGESDFFLVSSDGVWCFESYYKPFCVGSLAAFGTGNAFAIGAMEYGATSEEAVKVAIKYDPNSGGDVYTLKL